MNRRPRLAAAVTGATAALLTTSCSSPRCTPEPTSDAPIEWSIVVPSGSGTSNPSVLALPNGNYVIASQYDAGASLAGAPLPDGDLFIAEITPAGKTVWVQTFSGTGGLPRTDHVAALAADEQGDVYVAIDTQAHALTVGQAMFTNGPGQFSDMIVVAKLAGATGTPAWAQGYVNGTGRVGVGSIAARAGGVVFAGYFRESLDIGPKPLQAPDGAASGFIAKLAAADGTTVWADALRSPASDAGWPGARILSTGDVIVAMTYKDPLTGIALPTPPASSGSDDSRILLVKLSGADGTATADVSFPASSSGFAGQLSVDDADHLAVLGAYTSPATIGTIKAPDGQHAFVYAFDASFASRSLAVLTGPSYASLDHLFAGPGGKVAVVGSTQADLANDPAPLLAGESLGTPLGPVGTTALLVGVIDEATGKLVRGFDIPAVGRVQPGDPGSFRGRQVALGADGRLLVAAELDGIVNLDQCGVAGESAVFFSIAP